MTEDEKNNLVMEWFTAKRQLTELQEREFELRRQINESELFDSAKEKGTQTHHLGGNWELKLTRTENVSVENKNNEAFQSLMVLRSLGEGSAERANRLFRFSANLSETTYRELSPEEKRIVDPLITRKPGSFQLTLKEPKA